MEALAARGDWIVTVINPIGLPPVPMKRYADAARTPEVEDQGPLVVHHPRFTLVPGLSGRFNPALIARAVMPLVRRLHAEAPFDMVDAQFFYPDGPAAWRIARELGVPFAIKARGSDIHYWGARASALRQMRQAAGAASALLAVSRALARDMDALGIPVDKLHVHYTGLDHARFRPLPRRGARELASAIPELGIATDGRLLVSVGALIPVKGQALAIRAMAELPPDVHLVIVGSGPDEPALRALATSLGLSDRVRFLGAVSHDTLPTLLCAADAMVLPSEREGLANAWIEALACGTPVVIPDVGGAREVVDRPSAGRIVDRNAPAIAAAIRDLLDQAPAQEDVATCATRFSWEGNAAALAEIYEAAVARR